MADRSADGSEGLGVDPRTTGRKAASPVLLQGLVAWVTLPRALLLALALRVVWVLLCPNEPISDQVLYHEGARELAAGLGYVDQPDLPINFYPVGYAGLLAPFYFLFGPHYLVAYAVNVAFGVAGVAGAYELGQLLFGESAAKVAALFVAIHPTFVLLTTIIATENVFCAAVPWVLWLMFRTARASRRGSRLAAATGALLAFMVYVRPSGLTLLALPLAIGFLERVSVRRNLMSSAIATATLVLLLLPWGARNKREYGKFSVTSFNGGANLWMGNNPESNGSYMLMPPDIARHGMVERDAELQKLAVTFIREHPGRYILLTLNRVEMSLRSDTIAPTWNAVGIRRRFGEWAIVPLKIPCTLAHWGLLLGVVTALWHFRQRGPGAPRVDLELAVALFLLAFPFIFIVGGNRYMLPAVPLLCVWAASWWRKPGVLSKSEVAHA